MRFERRFLFHQTFFFIFKLNEKLCLKKKFNEKFLGEEKNLEKNLGGMFGFKKNEKKGFLSEYLMIILSRKKQDEDFNNHNSFSHLYLSFAHQDQ